jgi:hypothetical protein
VSTKSWNESSLEEKIDKIHDLLEEFLANERHNIDARNEVAHRITERLKSIDETMREFGKELRALQGKHSPE